jgi:hypothetical protein
MAGAKASGALHIEPLDSRIDVIHGRTLVVPVKIGGGVPPGRITARLDDRRALEARLYWISVEEDPVANSWLLPAGRWSVAAAAQARRESGQWVLVVELPPDALKQGLWIGGERLALNWYLDPALLPEEASARRNSAEQATPEVLALARPELLSPTRRWRYRLLAGDLWGEFESAAPFENPVLEALARQVEGRWAVALGMLWMADAEIARRVQRRLAAVIEFPDGTRAPAWPLDEAALEALLDELLNPHLTPAQRATRASVWLDTLPLAAAWVVDDAGLREAGTGACVSTVAVANLSTRDTVASAAAGELAKAELRPIPALSARMLAVASLEPMQSGVIPQEILFSAGRWSAIRTAVTGALPVSPPGLRLEPFTSDWTMAGWLGGAPEASMRIAPAWSTSVLLHYRAAEGADGSAGAAGSWALHLECRDPHPGDGDDEVWVWIGPLGAPGAAIRITRDGTVMDTLGVRSGRTAGIGGATVLRFADRWIAHVPIDSRLIDPSGHLLVGLVRTDARGVRSSWPRPMLPWQVEPGRLTVDTRAWGEIRPVEAVGR